MNPAAVASQMAPIFDSVSYYTNAKFVYSGAYTSPTWAAPYSDITISLSGAAQIFPSSSMWGRAVFPDASYNTYYYAGAPGDVFLNVNSLANSLPSYAPGSAGYFLFLHEIGHALGLKHPHDDGGTGRPTLSDIGLSYMDQDWFTIMSYEDDYNYNSINWDPATPMLMDVIALQYLYGKNMQTNAGDSTHYLGIHGMYETRWDASGIDTVNASRSNQGWVVVLPDTTVSDLVDTKAGLAMLVSEAGAQSPTTFYWLAGDYENVAGSDYGDIITGSSHANWISPNGGSDLAYGGGGDDTFVNIAGLDTFHGGDGNDTLWVNFSTSNTEFAKLRGNSFLIKDQTGNTAVCRDIETLKFSDATIQLKDLSIYSGIDAELVQIYVAAFRRAPEKDGYNYWAQQKAAHGLQAVADTIFSLDIVKAIYPAAQSANAFVTAIYQNVFNKAPDSDGLAYWAGELARKSRGQLVIDMTTAALGVADGVDGKDYFQNRVDWAIFSTGYLTAQNLEATPTKLTTLTAMVGSDAEQLLTLVGQVDSGLIFT